jgi:hypothetical protein
VIAAATLRPGGTGPTEGQLCIICGQFGTVDALLNVLLFVPLGAALSLSGVRPTRAVMAMTACSVLIEALQLRVVAGRDASIGDVMTNSVGGFLGFVAAASAPAIFTPSPRRAARLSAAWLALWLAMQVLVAYSFVPSLPDPPYHGQIERPAGFARRAFPGDVIAARVETIPLHPGALADASHIRTLFSADRGATMRVLARSGGPVDGRAELAVISGPGMVSVAGIEQDDDDLVFGLRTGADRLRLRTYRYRVPEVFTESGGLRRDTVLAEARYSPAEVTVAAVTPQGRHIRAFIPRLSQGWILFTPLRHYIDGDALEVVAALLFMSLVAAPAGWWGAFADARTAFARALSAVMLLAVAITGLVLVPVSFRLEPAAVWEWAFLGAGLAVGFAAGRAMRSRMGR